MCSFAHLVPLWSLLGRITMLFKQSNQIALGQFYVKLAEWGKFRYQEVVQDMHHPHLRGHTHLVWHLYTTPSLQNKQLTSPNHNQISLAEWQGWVVISWYTTVSLCPPKIKHKIITTLHFPQILFLINHLYNYRTFKCCYGA